MEKNTGNLDDNKEAVTNEAQHTQILPCVASGNTPKGPEDEIMKDCVIASAHPKPEQGNTNDDLDEQLIGHQNSNSPSESSFSNAGKYYNLSIKLPFLCYAV